MLTTTIPFPAANVSRDLYDLFMACALHQLKLYESKLLNFLRFEDKLLDTTWQHISLTIEQILPATAERSHIPANRHGKWIVHSFLIQVTLGVTADQSGPTGATAPIQRVCMRNSAHTFTLCLARLHTDVVRRITET